MDIITQEKIEKLIQKYDQVTTEIAEEIISELKKDCKTFGELEMQLKKFKGITNWLIDWKKAESLFVILENIVQKEKNDLLLTNRPKES